MTKYVGGDESLFLLQAKMLAEGILPVRDYFSKDLPYFMFPFSLSMSIFGFNIFVARITSYIFSAINVLLVFQITKKLSNNVLSSLFSSVILLSSILYIFEGTPLHAVQHGQTAITFLLFSLFFYIKSFEKKSLSDLILVYSLIALCATVSVWCRLPFVFPTLILALFSIINIYNINFNYKKFSILLLVVLFVITITSIPMIYLLINNPEKFLFSYFHSSEFFKDSNFYGMYGDYQISPWKFRYFALSDFLLSYRGQNGFIILLVILSIFFRSFNPLPTKSVNNTYWVVVLMCISLFIVYVFVAPHGFTWHYFGSMMPLLAIICFPVVVIILENKIPMLRIILIVLLAGSSSYGILKTLKTGSSYTHIEIDSDIHYLKELHEKIKNYTDINNKTYIDQPFIYFLSGNNPSPKYVNSSWLYQIFKANSFNKNMEYLHLPNSKQFLLDIKNRKFNSIVLHQANIVLYGEDFQSQLIEKYYAIEQFNNYIIYLPQS